MAEHRQNSCEGLYANVSLAHSLANHGANAVLSESQNRLESSDSAKPDFSTLLLLVHSFL